MTKIEDLITDKDFQKMLKDTMNQYMGKMVDKKENQTKREERTAGLEHEAANFKYDAMCDLALFKDKIAKFDPKTADDFLKMYIAFSDIRTDILNYLKAEEIAELSKQMPMQENVYAGKHTGNKYHIKRTGEIVDYILPVESPDEEIPF